MEKVLLFMILAPLVGAILNGLVLRPTFPRRAGVIATISAAFSFLSALVLWAKLGGHESVTQLTFDWFKAGSTQFSWGFRFDSLTAYMALVVTGIGTLIHCYSIGYMSHDKSPARYFSYLNLFLFNMLMLITSSNLLGMFVGWEGVGLCSYLLIGFWFEDVQKANAGMKAFLVNRIGDAGFLVGMFYCLRLFGTLDFTSIASLIAKPNELNLIQLNLAALFLFVGAMGKSAQIPLYVWLPDAMAGPTPVSALIHAATMVTAGVYLVCRMSALYLVSADTSMFVASIGAMTALFAALIATSQNDIKKVLAYSTVSQLGLMFMAAGCQAYLGSLFHLMTHAFFKALLFLGAGSVIHALDGEQDVRAMGGLKKKLPWTFWTFAIATAAISGLPPMSGFFSKDLLLYLSSLGQNGLVFWVVGSVTSLLTAFYMTRLFVLVFLGEYRGHAHPHESPLVMTVPLAILAIGSAVTGLLEVPHGFPIGGQVLHHFFGELLPEGSDLHGGPLSESVAMIIATTGAILSVSAGFFVYSKAGRADSLANTLRPLKTVFENKFWIDELYQILFVGPFHVASKWLSSVFDPKVIDASILLPAKVSRAGGTLLSFLQVGSAQFYILVMLIGSLLTVWLSLKGTVIP